MTRSQKDRTEMLARFREARVKKDEPLTVEEQRKCGYTPPGFKSSQPKARS